MDTTDFRARTGRASQSSDVGRLVFAVLAGAAVGAFGVFILTRAEVDAAKDARDDAVVELAASRSREALLGAELAVDEAVGHLDERNFGLAMAALDRAGMNLSAVRGGPAHPDLTAQVEALRRDVEAVRNQPADDVAGQMIRLRDVKARLAELAGTDTSVTPP